MKNDPDGDCVPCIIAGKILFDYASGVVTEIGTQMLTNSMSNKPILDIDYNDVNTAGMVNVVTGGGSLRTKIIGNVIGEGVKASVDVKLDKNGNTETKTIVSDGKNQKPLGEAGIDFLFGSGGGLGGKGAKVIAEEYVESLIVKPAKEKLANSSVSQLTRGGKMNASQAKVVKTEAEKKLSNAKSLKGTVGNATQVVVGGTAGAKGNKLKDIYYPDPNTTQQKPSSTRVNVNRREF